MVSYPLQPFLCEIQQHVDSIHVDPHILNGALLHFGHQQNIQTGQRKVTQQIHCVAEERRKMRRKHSHSAVMISCSVTGLQQLGN